MCTALLASLAGFLADELVKAERRGEHRLRDPHHRHAVVLGANGNGQVGVGDGVDKSTPAQVTGTWSRVATYWAHTCATKPDGTLWRWGWGGEGQPGQSTPSNSDIRFRRSMPFTWEAQGV